VSSFFLSLVKSLFFLSLSDACFSFFARAQLPSKTQRRMPQQTSSPASNKTIQGPPHLNRTRENPFFFKCDTVQRFFGETIRIYKEEDDDEAGTRNAELPLG
jgi:hypothetical protein